jgi:hypothetical protein
MTTRPRPVYLCECGNHAWASATRGFVALVSPEDAPVLASRAWGWAPQATRHSRTGYIKTGKHGTRLHRLVLSIDDRKFEVDHINGHGEDCRRTNLRLANRQLNARNSRSRIGGWSKYVGVTFEKTSKKWKATITLEVGKNTYLGYFESEEDAARAYDVAARKHFGEFARPNFP